MPELDGYGVLDSIKAEGLKCMVIVISADIQPEARERVIKAGALEFIRKPINDEKLMAVVSEYGLF
jgi:CheY-like chemotaxis protein